MILPLLFLASVILFGFVFRRDSSEGRGVVRRVFLIVVVMAIVGLFATGGIAVGNEADGGSSPLPYIVLLSVLALGVTLLLFPRSRVVADERWRAPTLVTAPSGDVWLPSPDTSVGDLNDDIGPSNLPSRPSAVARSLGRVESREMLQSPVFAVGLGFCVLILVLFVGIWGDEDTQSWAEWIQYLTWFVHPLVGMTVIAAHRSVTRARRDQTAELFDTCPAEQSTRTVGFLLTAVVPMMTIAIYVTLLIVGTQVWSPMVHGPLGFEHLGDIAGVIVLGAGGVVLGVALGRWLHFGLVPVVTVVAVALVASWLNNVGGNNWNPYRELSTLPTVEGPSPVFTYRPIGWHLLWLIALTGIVLAIALSRHRRDRFVAGVAIGSVVVAIVAGIAVTRPIPASAAREIAGRIAEPGQHQECVTLGDDRVTVCTFPLHAEFLDWSVERLGPIVEALPSAVPPITLRQVYDDQIGDLSPEIRQYLINARLSRPEGEVPFPYTLDEVPLDAGLDLALGVVGLPTRTGSNYMPYIAAGEARGVVALWLGSRGLDEHDSAKLSRPFNDEPRDAFERGSVFPAGHSCDIPPVVFSSQDLTAVRAVLDLPASEVSRVLEASWLRWIDPRTTTDQLLDALNLPGVGEPDVIVARPGEPC